MYSAEPERKRPRSETPESTAGSRWKLQRVSACPAGGLWPSHDIVLFDAGECVSVSGSYKHGRWYMSRTQLQLRYQCPYNNNQERLSYFFKVATSDLWVQVDCECPCVQCVLVRPSFVDMTPAERRAGFWDPMRPVGPA